MEKTLYQVLHVSPDADSEIIEAAYQLKLSKLQGRTDELSLNELKSLKWAYETVINPDRRYLYNQKISSPSAITQNSSYSYVQDNEGSNELFGIGVNKIIFVVACLIAVYFILEYKKVNVESNAVSGVINNQSRVIDVTSNINSRNADNVGAESQARIELQQQQLTLEKERQDAQIQLQRDQFSLQKERQEAQLQQQLEQQSKQADRVQNQSEQQRLAQEQYRSQRIQNYYSCVSLHPNYMCGTLANASR